MRKKPFVLCPILEYETDSVFLITIKEQNWILTQKRSLYTDKYTKIVLLKITTRLLICVFLQICSFIVDKKIIR